jgi:oxygen-independent coproporphyrinogen III oxidase
MNVPEKLIEKYNVPVPRYTSYPPANFFDTGYNSKDYSEAVIRSNEEGMENISLSICIYPSVRNFVTTVAAIPTLPGMRN